MTTTNSPTPLRRWDDYVDLLKPAGQHVHLTWAPEDEQTRAELYRQLAMNVALGYFLYFQSDPDHPDWTPFLNLRAHLPDDTPHVSAAECEAPLSTRRIGVQLRRRWQAGNGLIRYAASTPLATKCGLSRPAFP